MLQKCQECLPYVGQHRAEFLSGTELAPELEAA